MATTEDGTPCLEEATVTLINREPDDRLYQALERDIPEWDLAARSILDLQMLVQVCDEDAALILAHYPIMHQIECPRFGERSTP